MTDKERFGQYFTSQHIIEMMIDLRMNYGTVLEPCCGDGRFLDFLPEAMGIEISKRFGKSNIIIMDFFDLPEVVKFNTIIGNPPYVRFQDILPDTKQKLNMEFFNASSNLYLFFIEKCIKHLKKHGELIFIVPRDFLKATSARKLNEFIFEQGTITDFIDFGGDVTGLFEEDVTPSCCIFRFEKDNFGRKTIFTDNSNELFLGSVERDFDIKNGQLLFTGLEQYPVKFSDLFFVKVGAVSGNNEIFRHDEYGIPFVTSQTYKSGKTENYIYLNDIKFFHLNNTTGQALKYLRQFKKELLNRGIQKFTNKNWWKWGRSYYDSELKRIYVNCLLRTNNDKPFFINECKCYDGSVLAIFPLDQNLNIVDLRDALNNVNWKALGFMDGKRYKFSQRSLENAMLPPEFIEFLPQVENVRTKFGDENNYCDYKVIDKEIYARKGLYPKMLPKKSQEMIDNSGKKIRYSFKKNVLF